MNLVSQNQLFLRNVKIKVLFLVNQGHISQTKPLHSDKKKKIKKKTKQEEDQNTHNVG